VTSPLELRVLTGLHEGARAPVVGGERLGEAPGDDMVLTDVGAGVGAWLVLGDGCWGLSAKAVPEGEEGGAATAWGAILYLGELALTVSPASAPWPAAVARRSAAGDGQEKLVDAGNEVQEAPLAVSPAPASASHPVSPKPVQKISSARVMGVVGLAVIVMLLAVLWELFADQMASAKSRPVAQADVSTPVVASSAAMREVQLAIARVDPSWRLHVEPAKDGRVKVSGWLSDVGQLDRLADALQHVRPPPELAVRTAADLLDDLAGAVNADADSYRFELLGAGRVRVNGLVMTAELRDDVLQRLRARVPTGVEVVDGLTMASAQGPKIIQWLKTAGFSEAQAQWRDGQMHMRVSLLAHERQRLEALLSRPSSPLAGIPFVLQTQEVLKSAAVNATPAKLVHASKAPLPFRIRGVVGGANPYVVLGDGAKLQPGGRKQGWRLVAVEPDRLVFDGPRTLMIAR
jgi:type III secretion protein D